MGTRAVEKTDVDPVWLWDQIRKAGYSKRSFARALGISDHSLRTYLITGKVPNYVMKRVWPLIDKSVTTVEATLSVKVFIPTEAFNYLVKRSKNDHQATYGKEGYVDVILHPDQVWGILKTCMPSEEYASYIPADCFYKATAKEGI